MNYLEIILSFFIGIGLIVLLGVVFSLKTKGFLRLIINTVAGAVVLILLNVFGVVILPINPLNALIVGILGIPGVALIWALAVFL